MAELAAPFVSFLLENIARLLAEEGQFLGGVRDQAQQLQSKLSILLSLLQDADLRQDERAVFREWISQSKEVAYDAEDALEAFAFQVASRNRKGIANFLKRYSCILSECYMRHRVGSEIQDLQSRISELTKSFQECGISARPEEEGPSSRRQPLFRRTYSHVKEDNFIGLDNDVEMLVQKLTNEHEESPKSVASIFGMGGLGKTTIARKVYNHPKARQHFDAFAWVCISQQWQTKDILQQILVKIIPESREEILRKWTENELVGHLHAIQLSKKCLIVLDDIWSPDPWESMKDAFPTTETSRSKILLTTRNRNVAIHIGPNGFHHEPRLLTHDESWELLKKKAGEHSRDHGMLFSVLFPFPNHSIISIYFVMQAKTTQDQTILAILDEVPNHTII